MSPRPAKVSREQILAAALGIVDAQGLDALTMRSLGAALGVDPMVAYRLFPSKEAVADALVDQFWETFTPPDAEGVGAEGAGAAWRAYALAVMRALRQALAAHPRLIPLIATRPLASAGALRMADGVLGTLLRLGAPLTPTLGHLINTLVMVTVASALGEYTPPVGGVADAAHPAHSSVDAPADFPADASALPHLSALMQAGFSPSFDDQCEVALAAVLEGWPLPR